MKLRNILIVVEDVEKAKKFYHSLFGLDVILDDDGNVMLTEGLVLQDKKVWENFLERDVISRNNSCELYFEERDLEAFAEKLQRLYPSVEYVGKNGAEQGITRFYDPDGNLIEVRSPSKKECDNE